jgi:multidrug efflux pump
MFLSFNSEGMTELEVTDYAERYIVDRLSVHPRAWRAPVFRRPPCRDAHLDRSPGARRAAAHGHGHRECAASRERAAAGGTLESRTREFSLRTEVGLDTEEDFRNLAIGRGADGHLVRLGEVADVRLAAENDALVDAHERRPGVGIGIEAQSKANVLDVVRGVRAEVAKMQPICRRALADRQRRQRGRDRGGAARGADRGRVRVRRVLLVIYRCSSATCAAR